jgi:hypothetical protein
MIHFTLPLSFYRSNTRIKCLVFTFDTYQHLAEDNMNVQLKEVTVTARDGRVSQLEQVYIRGSQVRFFIVPDMLKNAPMFKNVKPGSLKGRGIGMGRGRATVARAQGICHFQSA